MTEDVIGDDKRGRQVGRGMGIGTGRKTAPHVEKGKGVGDLERKRITREGGDNEDGKAAVSGDTRAFVCCRNSAHACAMPLVALGDVMRGKVENCWNANHRGAWNSRHRRDN